MTEPVKTTHHGACPHDCPDTCAMLFEVTDLATASPGVAAIMLPKKILLVDAIPMIAIGKVNYPAVIELASSKKSSAELASYLPLFRLDPTPDLGGKQAVVSPAVI